MHDKKTINMSHGSGGQMSSELMADVFGKYFTNDILDKLEDGAVIDLFEENTCDNTSIVVSTDSFVVTPIEFRGGNIGKLAVCGTVNDVSMMGAIPKYLTCGFILEEGLEIAVLDRIVKSMAETAAKANVKIIAGDTKVVEKRSGEDSQASGLMINTTGIGVLRSPGSRLRKTECVDTPAIDASAKDESVIIKPSASKSRQGDVVIVSGNLGDHHACILSARMGIENGIESDCADLSPLVSLLYELNIDVHTMRDVTRGGLGTVLNEIASASKVTIEIQEEAIPVDAEVEAFCGIMGLDPVYMGNEGKFVIVVPKEDEEKVINALRKTDLGKNAKCIGEVLSTEVKENNESISDNPKADNDDNIQNNNEKNLSDNIGKVIVKTKIGGSRRLDMLYGEGLPRIC